MGRINRLRDMLSDDTAVYITAYPDIFYYSGFQSADASLIISKEKALIITDSRYTIQAREQASCFELYDIKNGLEGAFSLFDAGTVGYQEENISAAGLKRAAESAVGKEFLPMGDMISSLRQIKDKDEIERIRSAEKLGDEAFGYILERIEPGITEREIALLLEFYMRKNGASALSFETIVASGVRSAMPHGVASDKLLEKGDLITLDFGCVLDGYCSDMTRTVALGSISDKGREIYSVVKRAQEQALSAIKVGAELAGVDKAARDVIKSAGYGENFGHALGHSVGIEIHETPCFSPKAKGTVKNGYVISVEPGIYIDGFGGVRIEDLVAVNDNKCEVLSKSTKELIIL